MFVCVSRVFLALLALTLLVARPAQAAADMQCCDQAKAAGMVCSMCTPGAKAEIGKPAVDFMLKDADGKVHSLSADHKDQVRVLVWTNPDCPFVARHYKEGTFEQLAKQFEGKNVAILLIDSTSNGTPERTKAAAEANHLTLPVLQDSDGKIGHAYGAKTTPHVFVIDAKGTLVYAGAIDNDPQGDKPAAERINYAAKAVEAALAGQPVADATTKSYGCSVKYKKADEKKTAAAGDTHKCTCGDENCKGDCGKCKCKKPAMQLASALTELHCGHCAGDKKGGDKGCDKTSTSLTLASLITPLGEGCGGCKGNKEGDKTSTSLTLASLITPLGEGCGGCKGNKKEGDKTSTSLTLASLITDLHCGNCEGDKKHGGKKDGDKTSTSLTLASLLTELNCGKCEGDKKHDKDGKTSTSLTLASLITPLGEGCGGCKGDKKEGDKDCGDKSKDCPKDGDKKDGEKKDGQQQQSVTA